MSQNANLIIDRLIETFPACFDRSAPKPLKIGLGRELLALAGTLPALADLPRVQIRQALRVYTQSPAYQRALAVGGPRYGLDGQPTGEITSEQQAFARAPRQKTPAPQVRQPPAGPELSPSAGYLKMTLKKRGGNPP
ncbi:MAG: ProQ/FinO family protein [Candidatus Competibacter sp.]|nr:ProQ/FinO family protein [Candidatus Competibacter sp.]